MDNLPKNPHDPNTNTLPVDPPYNPDDDNVVLGSTPTPSKPTAAEGISGVEGLVLEEQPRDYTKNETIFSLEKTPPTPEILRNAEITTLRDPTTTGSDDNQQTAPPTTANTDNNAKIVDKSSAPLKLHHIDNPKDKLTQEADEEEERFIEEVEKHHEHL